MLPLNERAQCRGTDPAEHPLGAKGEATHGHIAVVKVLLETVKQVDSGADSEALGLIPSAPTLRPAGILTTAASLHGHAAALDVGSEG